MYSKIISQVDVSTVITLQQAKQQLRVTHDFDDFYIESLIPVAVSMAQSYSGRLLTLGSVVSVFEDYAEKVQLPFGEVTTVTSVELDGVASVDWSFEPVTQKITFNTTFTTAKVTYDCGYPVLPPQARQAILLLLTTMYDSRQDFIAGLSVVEMPLTSKHLLDTIKYYGI